MRGLGLTACLAVLALAGVAPAAAQTPEEERPLPAPVPVADDALTAALETGELSEAEYALERARSVFQLARVRREFGYVVRPDPRGATLILRDLAVRADDLAGADRASAKRLLARPPAGQGGVPVGNGWSSEEASTSPLCSGTFPICVHWVDAHLDEDAPDPTDDAPSDGIPDWVALTLETWEHVWFQQIVTLGYRAPLPDGSSLPDNGDGPELDVYLENLGSDGIFGYCTSDDPNADEDDVFVGSAYCVIDNDFAEFGGTTAEEFQEFLEVTSAHEFHHASQFAYDWLEDYWLMEGTATNIEETVYPAIDDNVNFLRAWSPLTRPGSPLDRGGLGDSEYGAWIFWRFLQEKIPGNPSILPEIWKRAATTVPDVYSLQAVTKELTKRGLAFRDVFAQFATANRLGDYDDAEDAGYPIPRRTAAFAIGRSHRVVGWRSWGINHLASRFVSFTPGASAPRTGKLRIEVRLPRYGARATVVVLRANGSVTKRRLSQGASGYARLRVAFGRGVVRRVEVVLSNGSTRTQCWQHQGVFPSLSYSCLGRPLDNNRAFQLRAQLVP